MEYGDGGRTRRARRTGQMPLTSPRIDNGVTKDELVEVFTHLAFSPAGRAPITARSSRRKCSAPRRLRRLREDGGSEHDDLDECGGSALAQVRVSTT